MTNLHRLLRSARAFSREFNRSSSNYKAPVFSAPAKLKLGIALGGGFARGLVHIGILKALEEENIPVDFVAGTSVGSIVGAMFCSGMSAREMEEVAGIARFRDFARWTLSRYGFCSNDRIEQFCARVLKKTTFEDMKIPLAVAATDFHTGKAVVFTEGPLVPPIRASCAYPGMFSPVEIGGHSYVDGMLAYGVPTTPLRQMGAERVIGIYLSGHWARRGNPRHIFEVIGQCFSIAQDRMSELWKRDADLVLEPNVNGFAYDCFDHAKELIAMGEASMREAAPEVRRLVNLPAPETAPEVIETLPVLPGITVEPKHSPAV